MKTRHPSKRALSDALHHGIAHRAKCPKCGLIGRRTYTQPKSNPAGCWIFNHGTTAGILGIPQAIMCFVSATKSGGYAIAAEAAARKGGAL